MKKVNSSNTPIYRDSGFNLRSVEDTLKAFAADKLPKHEPENYIYSRYHNPTVVAAEKNLAKLEGAKWALLTESGMAAIDVALSIFQEPDDKRPILFFTEIYGGTHSYIDLVLKKRRGLNVEYFEPVNGTYNLDNYIEILETKKPKLVYFEAISNPLLIVADGKTIIREAKKRGITVIVDNTFASPYLWKPLKDEADIVVHSVTKYISGHGNIVAGVLCGDKLEYMHDAIEYKKWTGHMMNPDDAYRINTQLKTFNLRFSKQIDNALKLADFLNSDERIEKVLYPGLDSHITSKEAQNMFEGKGYGAIVTFQLAGGTDDVKRGNCNKFIDKISEFFHLIPTLGDADTIFMPIDAVWGHKYPDPGTLRLSLGIEDFEYIQQKMANALDVIG